MALHAFKRQSSWLRWLVIVLAGLVHTMTVAIITRDDLLVMPLPPTVAPPSLAELNQSITLAERYLDGLYKTLDDNNAAQSEYYGLPLRLYLPDRQEWKLLSETEASHIEPGPSSETIEQYTVSFDELFVAQVSIRWNKPPEQTFSILVEPQLLAEKVDVWLGATKLGSYSPSSPLLVASSLFSRDELPNLASLRYTVRHATQQAYLYQHIKGAYDKSQRLAHHLRANGYAPGSDMRAIMFNRATALPDDYPFSEEGYRDCEYLPSGDIMGYPYKSKVCNALGAYFVAGERDSFLQASYALHVLQKYQRPDQAYILSYPLKFWIQGDTPAAAALHLRQQWTRTGVGIPACTPIGCHEVASGIRTFVHGSLETELGYHYGDPVAQAFADAAAATTVHVQIKDGVIAMPQGTAYRPAHTGSFPAYWNQAGQFAPPDPSLANKAALLLIGDTGMPSEYVGILPSNSETTFDAWTFLMRYRCLKYNVGCIL